MNLEKFKQQLDKQIENFCKDSNRIKKDEIDITFGHDNIYLYFSDDVIVCNTCLMIVDDEDTLLVQYNDFEDEEE